MSISHEHDPHTHQLKRDAALRLMLAEAEAHRIAVESDTMPGMASTHPDALTFAEKARKTLVAAFGTAATYVAVLATQDLSTVEGVIGALVAVAITAGVYRVPNATPAVSE